MAMETCKFFTLKIFHIKPYFTVTFKGEIDVNQIYTVKSKKLQLGIFCGYLSPEIENPICKFSNYKLIMSVRTNHTTRKTTKLLDDLV